MTRLYIIDDHFLIIEGLYTSFDLESDDFEVMGGSLTIEDALKKIAPEKVDIIILDLFIKQSDPVTNLLQVKKAFPTIPVVILSQETCLKWQVEMYRHGVKAYIGKDEDKSKLRQKLLMVSTGEIIIPDNVARIILTSNESKHGSQLFSDYWDIISHLSNGMNVKEIAKKLDQSESGIEKKLQTIRNYFQVKTNSELVYRALIKRSPQFLN